MMERMPFLNILMISLLLLPKIGKAQQWEKEKAIKLKASPSTYSSDFQDNFYLGFSDGSLIKFDLNASQKENFSLPNQSAISLIDVQNNLRPFLFYYDIQQITILDRFSSVPKEYPISEFDLDLVIAACPAPDGDFWVMENNPLRLKKINPLRKTTLLEVQISVGDSIKKIQAYQNILIVGDEDGIHAFDQFGSLLYEAACKNLLNFQLINESLILLSKKESIRINLFTGKETLRSNLPERHDGAIYLSDKLLLVKKDSLTLYKPR